MILGIFHHMIRANGKQSPPYVVEPATWESGLSSFESIQGIYAEPATWTSAIDTFAQTSGLYQDEAAWGSRIDTIVLENVE